MNKLVHAYWMAPLKPSPTQRGATAMCKVKTTPEYIAVNREVTCPECRSRLHKMISEINGKLMEQNPESPGFKRYLAHRDQLVALLTPKTDLDPASCTEWALVQQEGEW